MVILWKVWQFLFLGDMLNGDGGVDSAVVVRIRYAWNKFKELPYLPSRLSKIPQTERWSLSELSPKLHEVWK